MRCEDVSPHVVDFLAGTLPGATRDEIAAHVKDCPACQHEVEAFAETWDLLGDLPAERPDSTAMRARFAALVEGFEHGRARGIREPLRPRIAAWMRQPRRMTPRLQACAALLLLAAGVQVGRTLTPPAPPPAAASDVTAMRDELRDLRQMVSLSLMQQPSASERLKGVNWSSQIDQPGSEVVSALLDTLMRDPNVNVRLASIDALKRFAERDVVRRAAVMALDAQTSPLVQVALIDFLVEVGDRGALDTLRKMAIDEMRDRAVRARATWGVRRLEAAS